MVGVPAKQRRQRAFWLIVVLLGGAALAALFWIPSCSGCNDDEDCVTATFAVLATPPGGGLAPKPLASWGVLVDGNSGNSPAAPVDYQAFRSIVDSIGVGDLRAGLPNQMVAFAGGHRPYFQQGPWTDGIDKVLVTFAPDVAIDISVWILDGSFKLQHARVMVSLMLAGLIWNKEYAGVRVQSVQVTDMTPPARTGGPIDFRCADKTELKAHGYTDGHINVYVVDAILGGTAAGIYCGADLAVICTNAPFTTLVHELGHNMDLGHVNGLPHFDAANVMHEGSMVRWFLTEGQTFRAHLHASSALNQVFQARAATWQCQGAASQRCPPLHKRIWADGLQPSN